jgi:hypothetical protein
VLKKIRKGAYLADVDAGITFAKRVAIAQLSDDRDRVEPCVLRKRRRDDLEGVSVCLEAVCLHASEALGILRQHA